MARVLCWFGWHRWQYFGRQHLTGRYWTRYDRCPVCHHVRVRGEETLGGA